MTNELTTIQELEEQLKDTIIGVNVNIDYLGVVSGMIYESLCKIIKTFDRIKGLPSEESLKYEEIKKISSGWLLHVKAIEQDYGKFCANNAMLGAAGGAIGFGVVAFGPSLAMGVATTFGVASTGTAIAALNGPVAVNAALAWLGGGALAAGGGGIAAGKALLALAGPIGWTIGITSIATCGILYLVGRSKQRRLEEILSLILKRDIKKYKLAVIEIKTKVTTLINEMTQLIIANQDIESFGDDYKKMTEDQQYKLGIYVNLMLAATQNLVKPIETLIPKFSVEDKKNIPYASSLNEKAINSVVALASFLYQIPLDANDVDVLYKSLKNNENVQLSLTSTKKEFIRDYILYAKVLEKRKFGKLK